MNMRVDAIFDGGLVNCFNGNQKFLENTMEGPTTAGPVEVDRGKNAVGQL
jgi:hypothetical protein